jgi:hypothetical protein
MSTSTERRDDVSKALFTASRMFLQNRKTQMQNDINKLLSKNFSKTINDSTFLQLLRVVDQLLSLFFVEEDDIRQKLININKKLKRIESSTIKTKTNVESYVTAIKAEN